MTRDDFEALMLADGWSEVQRERWKPMTPLCDVETFRREMSKPDGIIEYRKEKIGEKVRLIWRRMWLRHDREYETDRGLMYGHDGHSNDSAARTGGEVL